MKTDFNVYNIEENPTVDVNILTGIPEIVNPNLIIPNNVKIIARLEIDDKNRNKIESITIPPSVRIIEKKAFMKCQNLRSVKIEGDYIELDEAAFFNCTALDSITLPKRIGLLGDCAFENCKKLKNIILPANIENIGCFVFNGIEEINIIYKGSKEELLKINGGKKFLEFYPQIHAKEDLTLDDLIDMGKTYGEINKILKGELEL